MKQRRNKKGRYARRSLKWTLGILTFGAIFTFGVMPQMSKYVGKEIDAVNYQPVQVAYAAETMEGKVSDLKASVLDQLQHCESAGATEDTGLIVFDTNHVASVGVFQFQVKTVIQYENLLYGTKITGKDALEIALDATKARALASDIIFKQKGGIFNWANCNQQENLAPTIEVIKKLEQ